MQKTKNLYHNIFMHTVRSDGTIFEILPLYSGFEMYELAFMNVNWEDSEQGANHW